MRAPLSTAAVFCALLACAPRDEAIDSVVSGDSLGLGDTSVSKDVRDTSISPRGPSQPWDEARARGVDFRAIGQEPGWMLEIDDGSSMYLLADYGEKKVTTPAPSPTDSSGVTIYDATTEAHHLTIRIRRIACSDVMSGEEMTHTVSVTLDTTEYRGCGRRLTP